MPNLPDSHGHYGEFGGRYAAETLMLAKAVVRAKLVNQRTLLMRCLRGRARCIRSTG